MKHLIISYIIINYSIILGKQSAKQNPEIKNQETEKNIKHKQPLAPRKKGSSLSIRYSKSVILSYSHTKS